MWRFVFALVAAAVLSAPSCAIADPTPDDSLGNDAKLDRRIQVSAEGLPVSDLLAAISKKSGLALRADPAVADDKVIVFGPNRPLRSVLKDIATLFNDNWRHYTNVEGTKQYVLYREPKALRYEDSLAAAVISRMQVLLDEQVRALDETPEQFAKRPEKDWIRQNFSHPILHGRTATRLYSLLDRGQRDSLFAQGYLNVSFLASGSSDQDTVRNAFKEAVAGLEKENERIQQENPNVHIVIDAPDNLAKYGIRFNLHHENNAGLSATVVQVIMGKASYMTMGEFDSAAQWLLPAHGNPYTRKAVALDARLPAPKDTDTAAREHDWIDQLRALANVTGKPIVADFYRSPALVKPLFASDDKGEMPAVTALDRLCRPAGYLWWMGEKTLFLRKRDWYRQRLYEVPDRWIRSVARSLAQHKGAATYGDLAQLLELSRTQIAGLNNLLAGGGGTPDDADTLAGVPELLKIVSAAADPSGVIYVGSLSPQLVGQLALPAAGMPPALRGSVALFLAARRQITEPADIGRFRVCLTCFGPLPGSKQDDPSPDPRGKVTVVAEWNPGPEQTPFDQRLQLYLPSELPDDRAGKTKIEVAP